MLSTQVISNVTEQARRQLAPAEKHTLRSPILLAMPERPVQLALLQELIMQWHEDGVSLQALWGESSALHPDREKPGTPGKEHEQSAS